MARPSPSCAHDDDRLRFPAASPSRSNSAEKKESTGRRLSQLCPPYVTPSSSSSLDHHRSDARIVENGFVASSGVSNSAKVGLGLGPKPSSTNRGSPITPDITLTRALTDPSLFGKVLHRQSFWTWNVVAKLIDGIPLTEPREIELFKQCTGRSKLPTKPVRRLIMLAGRRAGKDRFKSAAATWRSTLCTDWRKHQSGGWYGLPDLSAHAAPRLRLRPGERGPRHSVAPSLARAQEYPAHGALHGAGARPLQELLALIWRPAAGAVLPPGTVNSCLRVRSKPGRSRSPKSVKRLFVWGALG